MLAQARLGFTPALNALNTARRILHSSYLPRARVPERFFPTNGGEKKYSTLLPVVPQQKDLQEITREGKKITNSQHKDHALGLDIGGPMPDILFFNTGVNIHERTPPGSWVNHLDVETMADAFVTNLNRYEEGPGNYNTNKSILVVAGQMYGSGKTFIGLYWLRMLRAEYAAREAAMKEAANDVEKDANSMENERVAKEAMHEHAPILTDLEKKYSPRHVEAILKCVPITVNLQPRDRAFYTNKSLKEYIAMNLVEELVLTCRKINDDEFWAPMPKPSELKNFDVEKLVAQLKAFETSVSFTHIVMLAKKELGLPLFIHFDETDSILHYGGPLLDTTIGGPTRLYAFWAWLRDVTNKTGTTFYCSGRSTLLHCLGRGMYAAYGLYSHDGEVVPLWLSALPETCISSLIKQSKLTLDEPECELLAKHIKQRTCGIPRLVVLAIKYLKLKNPNLKPLFTPDNSLGPDFNTWIFRRAPREVTIPILTNMQSKLYIDMIVLATMGIPVDYEVEIDPNVLDIPSKINWQLSEVIRYFNVYIEPLKDHYKLLMPPMVLEYNFTLGSKASTQLADYFKTDQFILLKKGPLLEQVGLHALYSRFNPLISPQMPGTTWTPSLSGISWATYLPFLKGTHAGKHTATLTKKRKWPKMVNRGLPLGPNDNEKRKMIATAFSEGTEVEVNVADYPYLYTLHTSKEVGILYEPCERSSSADLFWFISSHGDSVHVQWKQGILEFAMLIDEVRKVLHAKAEGTLTFVVAAMSLGEKITNHPKKSEIEYGSLVMALKFRPSDLDISCQHNDEVDIVVLLLPGVEYLLTPAYFSLVHKQAQTKEKLVVKKAPKEEEENAQAEAKEKAEAEAKEKAEAEAKEKAEAKAKEKAKQKAKKIVKHRRPVKPAKK